MVSELVSVEIHVGDHGGKDYYESSHHLKNTSCYLSKAEEDQIRSEEIETSWDRKPYWVDLTLTLVTLSKPYKVGDSAN